MLGADAAAKTFSGHRMHYPVVRPVSTFVVKIHEMCNLNCTYCYMYNLKDTSFKIRPKRMTTATRDNMIREIRNHAERHGLPHVHIIIHGGEPLLVGQEYFKEWVNAVREGMGPNVKAAVKAQTNGVLIEETWSDLLRRLDVSVGISIDGPQEFNDQNRLDHSGRGSFDRALAGLQAFMGEEGPDQRVGSVLSVVTLDFSAREMWDFWMSSGAKRFDFLFPYHTHEDPPPFDHQSLSKWMIELFDIWWEEDDPDIELRYFENIMNLLLGSKWSVNYLGGKPMGLAVIETDGSVLGLDSLRACDDGLIELGLDINRDSLEEVLAHPLYRICNHSSAFVSEECAGCPAFKICGGGLITHRYSRDNGFNNPSVYCESIKAIITHIERRVFDSLRADLHGLSEKPLSLAAL